MAVIGPLCHYFRGLHWGVFRVRKGYKDLSRGTLISSSHLLGFFSLLLAKSLSLVVYSVIEAEFGRSLFGFHANLLILYGIPFVTFRNISALPGGRNIIGADLV